MLECPFTMYMTHLAPILGPVIDHMHIRLEKTWLPITGPVVATEMCRPLFTTDCDAAAALASRGGEEWFSSYYARSGLFVGDLDAVTAEAAVDKGRVEISRTFSDLLQTALALKGDWALVLANIAGKTRQIAPTTTYKSPRVLAIALAKAKSMQTEHQRARTRQRSTLGNYDVFLLCVISSFWSTNR